jgi:hypothetical protein
LVMAASPAKPDLLLFVAGEPDMGRSHYVPLNVGMRLIGSIFPVTLLLGSRQPSSAGSTPGDELAESPLYLPPDQVQCVNIVLEEAVLVHRYVTIVDVNLSSTPSDFVARYVGPDEIYPILVRPDGQRLEGFESFDVKRVRHFLRPPPPDRAGARLP